jgi:uncharacterized protein
VNAAADELTKPLGMDRQRVPASRRARAGVAAAVFMLFFGGAVSSWLLHRPAGPSAVASIRVRPAEPQAPESSTATPSSGTTELTMTRATAEQGQGAAVAARPQEVVPPASALAGGQAIRLNPAPDPRLTERTRYGLLPRIGPDGARPLDVYARPATGLPGGAKPVARVAVLISGLGIGESATADAVAKLPPAVTLAFAPYGSDLEHMVGQARDAGHEVMLQVPMEPYDYPDNDPGPHTLTVEARPQDNLERLSWVLGRFTGYIGLVNFMGAKLTADEAALAPILKEIGGRGLAFLDDGSSSRSVLGTGSTPATPGPAAVARAHAVIDTVPRAGAIDRELQRLEDVARERGFAVGTASALPVSVDRIARWAQSLEGRGILLVPVSSAFAASANGTGQAPGGRS